MSQRATAANAASSRRKVVRRRSTKNTLVQAVLTTIVANNELVSNATAAKTMPNLSVPMPLEFVRQRTITPVPVKRR